MNRSLAYLLTVALLALACDGQPEPVTTSSSLLAVYPNPCNGRAFVRVNNASTNPYVLKVFDPNGETLLEQSILPQNMNEIQLLLEDKPDGIYQIILQTGSSSLEYKLISNKQ